MKDIKFFSKIRKFNDTGVKLAPGVIVTSGKLATPLVVTSGKLATCVVVTSG
jgi:hypothetical protein